MAVDTTKEQPTIAVSPREPSIPELRTDALAQGLVAERYRVERVLGKGGGGIVVAATHLELGHRVAIKFILPRSLDDAAAVARFEREARTLARLRSQHAVRVFDFGRSETGVPFLVMEYLEGRTLLEILRTRSRIPIPEAVDYVLQACEALAEAHAMGITHRDLKPGNLFIATEPSGATITKIIDFGISKVATEQALDRITCETDTGIVLGSPGFMSPEQMQCSHRVDARSDIWSLGAVLYEAISGRPAFPAENVPQLYSAILLERPPPLHGSAVPEALECAILKCLEKDPRERFQDVGALASALEPFASQDARRRVAQIVASLSGRGRTLVTGNAAPRDVSDSSRARTTRRRRQAHALAAVALCAATLLGAWFAVGMIAAREPGAQALARLPIELASTRGTSDERVTVVASAPSIASSAPSSAAPSLTATAPVRTTASRRSATETPGGAGTSATGPRAATASSVARSPSAAPSLPPSPPDARGDHPEFGDRQ